ncbi:MAG: hypothetical protein A2514_06905 [Gammaproteobacteria bacterium RIFOXYD12_FULL_61_37]|nr:MAG: hypothetical protein A2514_06905 [Gammaproteobacteria bacterium RIFOXYD12_FULL_61_37]
MIRPHIDPADIQDRVVNAIGRSLSQLSVWKIMNLDLRRLPLGMPLASRLFGVTYQLLFLGIHRDDRISSALELLHLGVDVFELVVAIRMRIPLLGLTISLKAITQCVE